MTKNKTPAPEAIEEIVTEDVAAEPQPETIEVESAGGTTVVHTGTQVVDNTEAEEAPADEPESEEFDLGNGTTMVSYK